MSRFQQHRLMQKQHWLIFGVSRTKAKLLLLFLLDLNGNSWRQAESWTVPLTYALEVNASAWASAEIFPGGATSKFAYFLGCWRCNANGRSQNALPFQPHLVCAGRTSVLNLLSKMFSTLRLLEMPFLFINGLISVISSTFYKYVIEIINGQSNMSREKNKKV